MGHAKNYFVVTDEICSVLAGNELCRQIEFTRPSMSYVWFWCGCHPVDGVFRVSAPKAEKSDLTGKDATSRGAGLIMLIQ